MHLCLRLLGLAHRHPRLAPGSSHLFPLYPHVPVTAGAVPHPLHPGTHSPPPGHPGRGGPGVALPRRMVDHRLGPLYILVHGPGDRLRRGLGGLRRRVSAAGTTGLITQNAWADGLERPSAHAFILPGPERPGAISWCSRAGGCRRWCPRPPAPRSPPGTSPPPGRRSDRPPPGHGR